MKTHEVLDLHYHPSEGQGCFDGTREECEAFAATQSPQFMYRVVPMTKEEIEAHPDNQNIVVQPIRNDSPTTCEVVAEEDADYYGVYEVKDGIKEWVEDINYKPNF